MEGEVREGVGRGPVGGWMRVSLVGFLMLSFGIVRWGMDLPGRERCSSEFRRPVAGWASLLGLGNDLMNS